MAATRIYLVHEDGKAVALVRATSQAAAIRHVVGKRYEAIVADADHILANRDLELQIAGENNEPTEQLTA